MQEMKRQQTNTEMVAYPKASKGVRRHHPACFFGSSLEDHGFRGMRHVQPLGEKGVRGGGRGEREREREDGYVVPEAASDRQR